MKTALLGAGGQLADDLRRVLSDWGLRPFTHAELDICHHDRVRQVLTELAPEVVINCAAYVRVDDAEDDVEEAFRVNALAVRNLAQVCRDLDCTLVHISTDYVFDGKKGSPYTEDDCPDPLNVYGASKLAGENFVRNISPKHLVVRTSGLYGLAGSSGKGGNFVETMIRSAGEGRAIQVVDDQVLTPTYSLDLAAALKELIAKAPSGVYHLTNAGQCSWYQFAQKVFELEGPQPELRRTTTAQRGDKARRPALSVLDNRKTIELGLRPMRPWEDALRAYLQAREVAASETETPVSQG